MSQMPLTNWKTTVAEYQNPTIGRSLLQLLNTSVPLLLLYSLMILSLEFDYRLTFLLSIPTGLFTVRLFGIFHDCTHGSFFTSKRANEILGHLIGAFLFTPFYEWRRRHLLHHSTSSNLQKRGWWDIDTMTVKEYQVLSFSGKVRYRALRNPILLFLVAAPLFFVLIQRFPERGAKRREILNVLFLNLAIILVIYGVSSRFGFTNYLLIHLPVIFISTSIGFWLFYIQHQFEDSYWTQAKTWTWVDAALLGSSFYHLPSILQWFSLNLGFHHIHHLSPRIPNYLLERCHQQNPEFHCVPTINLRQSFSAMSAKLWDEEKRKMVSYPRNSLFSLFGNINGRLISHAPKVRSKYFGGSMSRAKTVTRIDISENSDQLAGVGKIVKERFFTDVPPFSFNVSFSCGATDWRNRGGYANPHSRWFNVFCGGYQIDAVQHVWNRPFGYTLTESGFVPNVDEIARLGKADWNYFSAYLYGVPLDEIRKHDSFKDDPEFTLGKEQLTAHLWDVVEFENIETVTAYSSENDDLSLNTPHWLFSRLWRISFGFPKSSPDFPKSFFPVKMRAKFFLRYDEFDHNIHGRIYRTFIFGGTTNNLHQDHAENQAFLNYQISAVKRVIEKLFPDR